jgi:hypothetical protein
VDGEKPLVALVPFWGSDKDIIDQFGDVLRQGLENEGTYQPQVVDMENLPEDVPEGGFPPYVCPSPSLTKEAPYSVTGEIVRDESELYHLRLYLWEMANVRLIYTDEIVVQNREECERFLPSTLEWLFSWLPTAEQAQTAVEPPKTAEEYWLHLGLRLGSSLRFYYRPPDTLFMENDVHHYYNISVGIQATVNIFSFLGVQAEVLFTSDYAPYKAYDLQGIKTTDSLASYNAPFLSNSLMLPLLVKGTLKTDSFFAAALAGVYLTVPLGEMQNRALVPSSGGSFSYSVDPPLGYTAGINLGTKAGPGNLFLDLRWAQDIGMTRAKSGETIYRRSMISISIGYELELLRKKK